MLYIFGGLMRQVDLSIRVLQNCFKLYDCEPAWYGNSKLKHDRP
jgi:hypothetical protein